MNLTRLLEAATDEFKQKLTAYCEKMEMERLTPTLAEQMSQGLQQALSAAGARALRTFLESYERPVDTLEVGDRLYRYKQSSTKRFFTPFGVMGLARRLYQADYGGSAFVPLDRQWGMEGEFATLQGRESVLFSCALVTPEETVQLLKKSALFHPSATGCVFR